MNHRFYISVLLSAWLGLMNAPQTLSGKTRKALGAISPLEVTTLMRFLAEDHYSRENVQTKNYDAITENFLEQIDPERVYFSAEDVSAFKAAYPAKSVHGHLSVGDLSEAHTIYHIYRERVRERTDWIEHQLIGWKISADDAADASSMSPGWSSKAASDAIWQNKLRREWIRNCLRGLTTEAAAQELLQNYQLRRDVMELSDEELEEIFLNSFTLLFDRHTTYFSPSVFNSAVGSNEKSGIGALLNVYKGGCFFTDILPGGPASLSGKVRRGDRLISIEVQNHELVDVVGLPSQHIVELISGPQKSAVSLVLLHQDTGKPELITLVRNGATLVTKRLSAFVRDVPRQGRSGVVLGVIYIPEFYGADMKGMKTSCSNDLEGALRTLDAAGVEGVIVDLRGNRGGYFSEAEQSADLFLGGQTVVRRRNYYGQIHAEKSPYQSSHYTKPVVVLVDEQTASGAEIVAQALRDFDHALVVGSKTAGAGTVQIISVLSGLNRGLSAGQTGAVKLTVQHFFLADGTSPEGRGIEPDITLPKMAFFGMPEDAGDLVPSPEVKLPNILPPIDSAEIEKLAKIRASSATRKSEEADLCYLTEWVKREAQLTAPSVSNLVSLENSISTRSDAKAQFLAEGEQLAKKTEPLQVVNLWEKSRPKIERKNLTPVYSDLPWIPSIDPALNESCRVLADCIE